MPTGFALPPMSIIPRTEASSFCQLVAWTHFVIFCDSLMGGNLSREQICALRAFVMEDLKSSMKSNADIPVFFMHISKTGGSSLVDNFREHLSDSEMCLWADQYGPHYSFLSENYSKIKFCSGHFYIDDWNRISEMHPSAWKKVTIVRDPFEQLASHLRWMDS